MRKQAFIPATVVAVMLAASLSGCAAPAPQQESGAASPAAQESATAPAPVVSDNASPEEILNAISADFEATEKSIADNLASTKTAAGDSYDTYVANKGAIPTGSTARKRPPTSCLPERMIIRSATSALLRSRRKATKRLTWTNR